MIPFLVGVDAADLMSGEFEEAGQADLNSVNPLSIPVACLQPIPLPDRTEPNPDPMQNMQPVSAENRPDSGEQSVPNGHFNGSLADDLGEEAGDKQEESGRDREEELEADIGSLEIVDVVGDGEDTADASVHTDDGTEAKETSNQ